MATIYDRNRDAAKQQFLQRQVLRRTRHGEGANLLRSANRADTKKVAIQGSATMGDSVILK